MPPTDSFRIARYRGWSLILFWIFVVLWLGGLLLSTAAVLLISRAFFALSSVVLIVGAVAGVSSTGLAILVWLKTRRPPLWLAFTLPLAVGVPAILWFIVDAFLKRAGPLNP